MWVIRLYLAVFLQPHEAARSQERYSKYFQWELVDIRLDVNTSAGCESNAYRSPWFADTRHRIRTYIDTSMAHVLPSLSREGYKTDRHNDSPGIYYLAKRTATSAELHITKQQQWCPPNAKHSVVRASIKNGIKAKAVYSPSHWAFRVNFGDSQLGR